MPLFLHVYLIAGKTLPLLAHTFNITVSLSHQAGRVCVSEEEERSRDRNTERFSKRNVSGRRRLFLEALLQKGFVLNSSGGVGGLTQAGLLSFPFGGARI